MAEFRLPELGEDIEEADVLKVLVSEGDAVEAAQLLIEIETEKATLEVPAEIAGTITKIHVSEGDTIKVGQLIMTIEPAAAGPRTEAEPEEATEMPAVEPAPAEEEAEAPARAEEEQPAAASRDAAQPPTEAPAPTAK